MPASLPPRQTRPPAPPVLRARLPGPNRPSPFPHPFTHLPTQLPHSPTHPWSVTCHPRCTAPLYCAFALEAAPGLAAGLGSRAAVGGRPPTSCGFRRPRVDGRRASSRPLSCHGDVLAPPLLHPTLALATLCAFSPRAPVLLRLRASPALCRPTALRRVRIIANARLHCKPTFEPLHFEL